MTSQNNRALLLYYAKLCAYFQIHQWIQTEVKVRKYSIRVEIGNILSRVTLKFYVWHWKTIGHLLYTTFSFVYHFKSIGEVELELQPETLNSGQNWWFFFPCDLEIRWMTLKNNRSHLLYYMKLCASFQSYGWIQTGFTVRKRLNGVMTSVTLTFDLWPWPFV